MTTRRTAVQAPRRPALAADAGFTLIEVIVALTLLALLSTAALYFFVSGSRTITHQQRSHTAVSAANDAMEQVFSYIPQMAGSTVATTSSGLLVGRLDTDVTAAWSAAAAAGVVGIAETYPGWDRATSPAPQAGIGDDRVKLVRTVTSSGVSYSVTTLIGYCYRIATNPNGVCTRVGGDSVGNPNAGYVRMMRSIVLVRWPGTANTCASGSCTYQIQSLIDPNSDLKWNNTTRLQSFDDAVQVNAGESVTVDVLGNDSVMELSTNPVSLTSLPLRGGVQVGTATVDTASGKIVYDAPTDGWGEVTIGYRVQVGARTTQATVHAYITPQAPDLVASVYVGQAVELPLTPGSGVTAGSLVLTQAPSQGTVTMPGGSPPRFRYQAGGSAGTFQFRYTYRDSTNTTSLVGVATVTVAVYAPGLAPNLQYPLAASGTTWPAQATTASRTLDVRADSGNPTGYQTIVRSAPTGGTLSAPLNSPVTGALTWTQPANGAGAYTFTYQVVAPDGSNASPMGTATILVPPVAQNRTVSIRKSQSGAVTLTSLPATGVTYNRTSNPTCANATAAATAPNQTLTAKNSTGSCTFTYTVSMTTPSGVLTSAPATVTVTVTS